MRGIAIKNPQIAVSHASKFKRVLADREASVMMTALRLFRVLVEASPATYKSLLPAFVHIHRQIIGRHLPDEYDHHGVPALWAQVDCIQIFRILVVRNET
ncbi:AP-4 complex subunit epsilon-1, partial [Rhizophlyctis rosea]